MKYGDRASGSARQNHRARLRDVARTARTVDGDSDVASSSRLRAIAVRPSIAPRDELPCAVPNPSRSITRRVHWPSKLTVLSTTMPRFRQIHAAGKMQRCQNAPIPRPRHREFGRRCAPQRSQSAVSDQADGSPSTPPTQTPESASFASVKVAAWQRAPPSQDCGPLVTGPSSRRSPLLYSIAVPPRALQVSIRIRQCDVLRAYAPGPGDSRSCPSLAQSGGCPCPGCAARRGRPCPRQGHFRGKRNRRE